MSCFRPCTQESYLNNRFRDLFDGAACTVIAGGPSVSQVDLTCLGGVPVIAVNPVIYLPEFRALRKDFVAAMVLDEHFLQRILGFVSLGVTYPVFTGNTPHDSDLAINYLNAIGIHRIPSNHTEGLGDSFSDFSNGGNSGFAAIQLAVILGFKTIGLLGIDGVASSALPVNFHKEYGDRATEEKSLSEWCIMLDSYAPLFECLGIELVNLSPISVLRAYRKIQVQEWKGYLTKKEVTEVPSRSIAEIVLTDYDGQIVLPYRRNQPPGEYGYYDRPNSCHGGATNVVMPNRYRPVHRELLPFVKETPQEKHSGLEKFRGIHKGERIAVLGSGPTLELYDGDPSLAIAVNGAAEIDRPYRYFVCGDPESPERPWFYASRKQDSVRIVSSYVAPFDSVLYPDEDTRRKLQEEGGFLTAGCFEDFDYDPSCDAAPPHAIYQYDHIGVLRNDPLPIFPDQERLLYGGTIAGVAVQMAFILGASEIHLFGCSLDNDSGSHYHPKLTAGKLGYNLPSHVESLSRIVSKVEEQGVPVIVHGYSRLEREGIKTVRKRVESEKSVICVKWGEKYSAEYVNNLQRMVARNLTYPHRFVCLTDDDSGLSREVETLKLPRPDLEFCWSKLNVFAKDLDNLRGTALFLDLDVIVVDELDCLFEYASEETFIGPREWAPSSPDAMEYHGSLFRFRIGELGWILEEFLQRRSSKRLEEVRKWDEYLKADAKVTYKDSKTGDEFRSDQVWMSRMVAETGRAPVFPREWSTSYKYHCQQGIPSEAKVIVFHGYPKPHELEDARLLQYWNGTNPDWLREAFSAATP